MNRLNNIFSSTFLPVFMFWIFMLLSSESFPQTVTNSEDSTTFHSPKKAAIMSAALPGLGQAYNKKYWKIPIIYAGFGTLIYFIQTNGSEYRNFKNAYNIVATGDTASFSTNEYVVRYNRNINQLQEGRNYYRRNLELSYILTGMLYILQIIDASVDANLFDFDVSDDLTFRFEPMTSNYFLASKPTPGITLKYRF